MTLAADGTGAEDVTTQSKPIGIPVGGRPINLSQLERELQAQGVAVKGLGMHDDWIYTYDDAGELADFTPEQTPTVQQAINAHVGKRDKTPDEYAAEFQNPATSPSRKQEIRDITAGLIPRDTVE